MLIQLQRLKRCINNLSNRLSYNQITSGQGPDLRHYQEERHPERIFLREGAPECGS